MKNREKIKNWWKEGRVGGIKQCFFDENQGELLEKSQLAEDDNFHGSVVEMLERGKLKRRLLGGNQTELFEKSSIAVSVDLYNFIVDALEEKIGEQVKKITKSLIRGIASAPEFDFKNVFFVSKGPKNLLAIPVSVLDIYYPSSFEHGIAETCLALPLHGDYYYLEEIMRRLAFSVGLKEVAFSQNGLKVLVVLKGERFPFRITPNPFPPFRGNGGRAFVTEKEIRSGRYSPIY